MTVYKDRYGNELELPKYTLELNERFTEAANGGDDTESMRKKYELLKEIVDAEYLADRLEGEALASIDIVELVVLFSEINAAYKVGMTSNQLQDAAKMLEQLSPIMEQFEKIQGAAQAPKMPRNSFKRIK